MFTKRAARLVALTVFAVWALYALSGCSFVQYPIDAASPSAARQSDTSSASVSPSPSPAAQATPDDGQPTPASVSETTPDNAAQTPQPSVSGAASASPTPAQTRAPSPSPAVPTPTPAKATPTPAKATPTPDLDEVYPEANDSKPIEGMEPVALDAQPAVSTALVPEASGDVIVENEKARIDLSNTEDGYVMIRNLENTTVKLKVLITGPSATRYSYNLDNGGKYEVFPLSDGNGEYKIGVYKNISGTKYSTSLSTTQTVRLKDEFAPFLHPNQYVNFTPQSKAVAKAAELIKGCKTDIDRIGAVYTFVINTLTYDKERAATVTSGYLPDIDDVLAKKKGICFDYAALMTAMLRSQGIPTKLVVGYAGTAYHAWINVYTKENGWVNSVILFDGQTWKLMDPTFASSGNSSDAILQYIGNGANYTAKYLY